MHRLSRTSPWITIVFALGCSSLCLGCEPEREPEETPVVVTPEDMREALDMAAPDQGTPDLDGEDSGADRDDMGSSPAPDADMAMVNAEDMVETADMSSGECAPGECGFVFYCDEEKRCVASDGAALLTAGNDGVFAPPETETPDDVNMPAEPLGALELSMQPLAVSECPPDTVPMGAEIGFGASDRDGIEDNLLKFRLICQGRQFPAPAVGDVVDSVGSESLASDFDFGTSMVFAEYLCQSNEVLVGIEARTMNTSFEPFEFQLTCAEVYLDARGFPRTRNLRSSGWLNEGGCDRALAAAGAAQGASSCVTRGSSTCIREEHFLHMLHVVREEGSDRDHASAWQATCRSLRLDR